MRGTHTHGWGEKKKHRGKGHRGGKGNAGSGKKADQKKPSYWDIKGYFGKKGFVKKGMVEKINSVNISYIEEKIDSLIAQKAAELKNGVYAIDLGKLGFNKLLGCGKATKKYNISVKYASGEAEEKIKGLGGEIIKTKGAE